MSWIGTPPASPINPGWPGTFPDLSGCAFTNRRDPPGYPCFEPCKFLGNADRARYGPRSTATETEMDIATLTEPRSLSISEALDVRISHSGFHFPHQA